MMKHLPSLLSFGLFLALCASLTYWALQLFAPPPRPVLAPPQAERKMPPITAAENLFGGHASSNSMANMQLRGVIYAGQASDSEAILVVGNAPPQYLKVNAQVAEGVSLKEIHPRYVLLNDHGVSRELSLPEFAPAPLSTLKPNSMYQQPTIQQPLNQQPPNQQPMNPSPEPPAPNTGANASGGSAAEEQSSAAKGTR